MIARKLIAPPVDDVVAVDDEGASETQDADGNISKLHVLGDGRDFGNGGEVVPPTLGTEIRCRHALRCRFHYLRVLLVDARESGGLVGVKVIAVDKDGIPWDIRVFLQEDRELVGVSDGNEDGPRDRILRVGALELTPRVGVSPAVGSSEMPQEDDDGSALAHEVTEGHLVAIYARELDGAKASRRHALWNHIRRHIAWCAGCGGRKSRNGHGCGNECNRSWCCHLRISRGGQRCWLEGRYASDTSGDCRQTQ
mmetsp:Transcript_4448/g.11687  ORF Transcript_4448/g.11687 Transcript_4448/m.11687 type:complete len:253 (-) Transcript_4448:54-812(-)